MGSGESVQTARTAAAPREPSRAATLARLALEVARAHEGVVDGTGGRLGQWSTPDRGERLAGVVAAARQDGRFDVELHLIVRPVPLHPLAERIRDGLEAAARAKGVEALLGPVDISFEDLDEAPAQSAGEGP